MSGFEFAVRKVLADVSFDTDVNVSVFETNIRALGGLLSAHFLCLKHLEGRWREGKGESEGEGRRRAERVRGHRGGSSSSGSTCLSRDVFARDPTRIWGAFAAWYRDELLALAEDLGRRLLPAFNTKSGVPYGTVNLRHGVPPGETVITSAAGLSPRNAATNGRGLMADARLGRWHDDAGDDDAVTCVEEARV
eukprot:330834-Rhodomonas_salina.2